MEERSDYGKGFVYCLGLFLAHEAGILKLIEENEKIMKAFNGKEFTSPYALWFYAAADHLFDFDVKNAPAGLKGRAQIFRERCLELRMTMDKEKEATKEDFVWAVNEAKDLLYSVDRSLGIKAVRGDFE